MTPQIYFFLAMVCFVLAVSILATTWYLTNNRTTQSPSAPASMPVATPLHQQSNLPQSLPGSSGSYDETNVAPDDQAIAVGYLVELSSAQQQRHPLYAQRNVLGQSASHCHVFFAEASDLAASHAHIIYLENQFWLADLSGLGTTYLNGESVVEARQVNSNDEISLGQQIRLQLQTQQATPPMPQEDEDLDATVLG